MTYRPGQSIQIHRDRIFYVVDGRYLGDRGPRVSAGDVLVIIDLNAVKVGDEFVDHVNLLTPVGMVNLAKVSLDFAIRAGSFTLLWMSDVT